MTLFLFNFVALKFFKIGYYGIKGWLHAALLVHSAASEKEKIHPDGGAY